MHRPLLLLLACLWLAPLPAAAQEAISNARLLESFAEVAFGREHEQTARDRLLKWRDPINAAIIGREYPAYFEAFVRDQLADLAYETRHPISLVYSETMVREKRLPPDVGKIPVNMLLFYLPKAKLPAAIERHTKGTFKAADIQAFLDKSICHVKLRIAKGVIRFAVVAFPAEHDRYAVRACVVEELTQIMGLPNDSDRLAESIFSDTSRHLELTGHDRWLLRMLYADGMEPGMAPEQALAAAERFLAKARPE